MANHIILKCFVFIFVYAISFFLLGFYTLGDQYHYHKFYSAIDGIPLSDLIQTMSIILGAAEPLSGLILWIGSNLNIDKNIFISVLNALFFLGVYNLCLKHRSSVLFIFLLLTNFYVIVLFTGAERLKIAFIFIVYGLYFDGVLGKVFLISSVFSHFQSLIFIFSFFFKGCINSYLYCVIKLKVKKGFLITLVAFSSLLMFLSTIAFDAILTKVNYYLDNSKGLVELTQQLGLSIFAFLILGKENGCKFFILCMPIYVATYLFSSDRMNMIALCLFLYLCLIERRTNNLFVILLLVYLSIKSIGFVNNIILYGNGFY